jgi:hypothetical protein
MPHLVRTDTSSSIHVTLSINTLTWADLLTDLTAQIMRSDAFARPLPMGHDVARQAEPLLKHYADELAARLADSDAAVLHRAIYSRPAFAEGHRAGLLRDALLDAPPPGRQDRIALRPGTWPVIAEPDAMAEGPGAPGRGEAVRIEAGGRAFHVAPEVADACRRLLDGGPLPVEALSADPVAGARIAEVLLGLGLCTTSPH